MIRQSGALLATIALSNSSLGAHMPALERADDITTEKMFVDRKPRTVVKATAAGRRAFAEHVALLKSVIEQ